jgi:hypothetical protein
MTIDRWLSIGQILVPIVIGILIFAARSWFEKMIDKRMEPLETTVQKIHTSLEQRNGGSSVRDQLVFIREDIAGVKSSLAEHIIEHNVKTTRTRKAAK